MSNLYVNLEVRNTTAAPLAISLNEKREPRVLDDPEDYKVAVDRFSIHKAWLPIYEDAHTLTVKVIKQSDSSYYEEELDFSAVVDSNNLLWSVDHFISVFNNAIDTACQNHGLAANACVLSIDRGTWKATLDFSTVANFAANYYVELDEPLFSIFPTFLYSDVGFSTTYFRMNLTDASPYTSVTEEEIELSPVDKIYIKSNQMPVVYELTPGGDSNATKKSESIITDFEFSGANVGRSLQNISYTATSGQYRYHSMETSSSFNTIDLQFYYKTYANNSQPLYFLPSGSCNVKLLFEKV